MAVEKCEPSVALEGEREGTVEIVWLEARVAVHVPLAV